MYNTTDQRRLEAMCFGVVICKNVEGNARGEIQVDLLHIKVLGPWQINYVIFLDHIFI
jgi:hypothetical protein